MLMLIKGLTTSFTNKERYFNTSHVNVNPPPLLATSACPFYFNTSHVNVNQDGADFNFSVADTFQYISC